MSECLDQQNLIAKYLVQQLDQAPCILVHGDLTVENIIVDEEFKVKAYVLPFPHSTLIHLTHNHAVSSTSDAQKSSQLQFSACFPNFLTHEFQSPHEPLEVEHGSGADGPLVWQTRDTAMMRRDRAVYVQYVKEISRRDEILEVYYQLLASRDEIKRFLWLMAATKLKVHRAMAACNWLQKFGTDPQAKPPAP